MSEPRNIVVLGAGFAGLSAAHYFMRHIYPSLKQKEKNVPYKLHLVDQSSHFWWHIAAPREIASTKLMPHNDVFFPIMDGFKQYTQDKDIVTFHQAQPVAVDTANRRVTLQDTSEGIQPGTGSTDIIPYYALVIATGTSTPTPLTSFHGDHKKTQQALEDINKRLGRAKSVIIAGGGPIAVETAGEIGEALNGTNNSAGAAKVKITVVAGGKKLLPVLSEKFSKKAERFLEKVGADVKYGTKVSRVEYSEGENGKTTVILDNGETMTADVYIPATGAKPNTGFLPQQLINERGFVKTNATTLRVEGAGELVYALGDVGSYTRGGVMDLYAATPVFGNNFAADLGVNPAGGYGKPKPADKHHKADESETQIVPVGSKAGVGAFKGWGLPSFMVSAAKGKKFLVPMIPKVRDGEQYRKA